MITNEVAGFQEPRGLVVAEAVLAAVVVGQEVADLVADSAAEVLVEEELAEVGNFAST